jgi:hypothetical protein
MQFNTEPLPNSRAYLWTPAKCLKLDITVPHEEMAAEACALRDKFISYRNQDSYGHQGWYSLPIFGLSLDKPLSWDAYGYANANEAAKDFNWTEIAEQCPVTVNWLKTQFPSNRLGRVRFMLLEAGGFIAPHIDSPHSVPDPVNIALTNPKECIWQWGDGTTLDFAPGSAYAMNISYEHSIYNRSKEDRYHLIVHHHDSTEEWKQLMTTALEKQDEEGYFYYSTDLY